MTDIPDLHNHTKPCGDIQDKKLRNVFWTVSCNPFFTIKMLEFGLVREIKSCSTSNQLFGYFELLNSDVGIKSYGQNTEAA